MTKSIIAIIIVISLIVSTAIFGFLVPLQHARAISLGGITSIIKTVVNIIDSTKAGKSTASITFPFGGRITSSGTACKLKFTLWQIIIVIFGVPVPVPFPVSIPITGTVIDVGPPGLPTDDVYTFPGISDVYANNNENKVGAWTLGIAMTPKIMDEILDKINSALDSITFTVPNGWVDNFSLDCPDGGVILKIGTS